MTGTSKALARLGVTGLGAVVMFAGLMPLTELAANAATYTPTNATSVSLSPDQDTAAVTTCNEFTATIAPSSTTTPGSVTVQISQATGATNGTSSGIRFCDPLATNPDSRGTVVASPTPGSAGTPGANTTVGATYCFTTTAPAAGSTSNVSCEAPFTDTNGDGKIVFGVLSTETGTMTVSAFGDTNGNGAQDVGENGDTSTKTWVSNTAANTDKINCSPTSATNDTGDTHTFTCSVTNANGVALSGQKVGFTVTSGPDAGVSYNPVTNTSTPASDVAHPGPGDATCNTTDNGASGTTVGQATCSFTNNGVPGTDSIRVYEDTNGVSGQQAGE
ncbi:MAG TPA: hypothetical protein VFT62_10310, partial [Mycobacteriales bacterium]|nr:hypothetical protein [Mycobacteriales bacterium]